MIPSLNQAWAGDDDSTIKVVDLQTQKVVATISTDGNLRADELAYDRDQVIMIGNDFDAPPFLGPPPRQDCIETGVTFLRAEWRPGRSGYLRSGLIAALLGGWQRVKLPHSGSLHQSECRVP